MKSVPRLFALLAAFALFLAGCAMMGSGTPVNVAAISPKEWATLNLKAQILSVSVKGAPVVTFKVTDQKGNAVIGLGSTMKRATDQLASYPNVAFTLAKLVPGTNGSPSQWVNYLVTATPTVAAPNPTAGRFPGTDNVGKLLDKGSGLYEYTFYRDVTKAKEQIAATADTATYKKADLGDLTFDPALTHRLGLQISGNAPGTGTNTPTGVQTVAGVAMKNPVNVTYDFIPATGSKVTASTYHREITLTAQCNTCHGKLNEMGFHGGSRYEIKYCVTCHTDQIKVNTTEAALAPDGKGYTGTTDRIQNLSPGDFTVMVHKLHMGRLLTMKGYNWLNRAEGQFNNNVYPQKPSNCLSCHTRDTKAAPQANHWQTAPSRQACGSCHDGINWQTNTGPTVHEEGAMTDDSKCATCHEAADIAKYHGVASLP